jgi:heptaprenylglyceryl phosphate synthase
MVMVYADNVNISSRSVYTINKSKEALVVVSQEIGLKVNACRTGYVVMSLDQNVGWIHSIKIDNNSFERVKISNIGNSFKKSKLYSGRN